VILFPQARFFFQSSPSSPLIPLMIYLLTHLFLEAERPRGKDGRSFRLQPRLKNLSSSSSKRPYATTHVCLTSIIYTRWVTLKCNKVLNTGTHKIIMPVVSCVFENEMPRKVFEINNDEVRNLRCKKELRYLNRSPSNARSEI
jgi:hypothetical protein